MWLGLLLDNDLMIRLGVVVMAGQGAFILVFAFSEEVCQI